MLVDQDEDCADLQGYLRDRFGPGLHPSVNETLQRSAGRQPLAGTYRFPISLSPTTAHTGCYKSSSDNRVIININPEVPRLILSRSNRVPISTVGEPFSLQMSSNLPDAKAW